MKIQLKRVYEQPADEDGFRVLVDRLWPRGLTKEKAHVDLWLKEVAPSTALREWFAHDPEKWRRFRGRYETELRHNGPLMETLTKKAAEGTITLLYGARDEKHNEAVVLKQFLERSRLDGSPLSKKGSFGQKAGMPLNTGAGEGT
jgi:uncharacterized protein YeaO (DUF488 family)